MRSSTWPLFQVVPFSAILLSVASLAASALARDLAVVADAEFAEIVDAGVVVVVVAAAVVAAVVADAVVF